MSYKYIIGAARGDLLAISMKYNSHWYNQDEIDSFIPLSNLSYTRLAG